MRFDAGDSGVLPVFYLGFGLGPFPEQWETLQAQAVVEYRDLVSPGEVDCVVKGCITGADDGNLLPGSV